MRLTRPHPPLLSARILFVTAALHAAATGAAFMALVVLTGGGGDGPRDSPAIDAAAGVLQALGVPLAWAAERLIDTERHAALFAVVLGLRIVNSLAVGTLVAWGWAALGRARSAESHGFSP